MEKSYFIEIPESHKVYFDEIQLGETSHIPPKVTRLGVLPAPSTYQCDRRVYRHEGDKEVVWVTFLERLANGSFRQVGIEEADLLRNFKLNRETGYYTMVRQGRPTNASSGRNES